MVLQHLAPAPVFQAWKELSGQFGWGGACSGQRGLKEWGSSVLGMRDRETAAPPPGQLPALCTASSYLLSYSNPGALYYLAIGVPPL